jgi:hypothetical protein
MGLHRDVLALAINPLLRLTGLCGHATASVLDRLQPETLGGVEYGFREAVQRGGAGVETAGEAAPPGVQKWIDGVRAAAANF